MSPVTTRKLRMLERLEITRCLRGVRLECGCLAGVYQTRAGLLLAVIDATSDGCTDRSHQEDFVILEPVSPADLDAGVALDWAADPVVSDTPASCHAPLPW